MITFRPGPPIKLYSYTSPNVPCYWIEADISSVNSWNGVLHDAVTIIISFKDL